MMGKGFVLFVDCAFRDLLRSGWSIQMSSVLVVLLFLRCQARKEIVLGSGGWLGFSALGEVES